MQNPYACLPLMWNPCACLLLQQATGGQIRLGSPVVNGSLRVIGFDLGTLIQGVPTSRVANL